MDSTTPCGPTTNASTSSVARPGTHHRRAAPRRSGYARATAAGATHTQWCDQLNGDASSPQKATASSTVTSSPTDRARRAASSATARNASTSSTHSTNRTSPPSGSRRCSTPLNDWLNAYAVPTFRSVPNTASNQKRTESPGARANPSRIDPANVPTATAAARYCRLTRKNSTKISGVSLIPAARPVSRPRGHRVRGSRQSTTTSPISSRLTCPRTIVCRTGSISSHPAATAAPNSTAPVRLPCLRPATTVVVASSATSPAATSSTVATSQGSRWAGTKATAASGG